MTTNPHQPKAAAIIIIAVLMLIIWQTWDAKRQLEVEVSVIERQNQNINEIMRKPWISGPNTKTFTHP